MGSLILEAGGITSSRRREREKKTAERKEGEKTRMKDEGRMGWVGEKERGETCLAAAIAAVISRASSDMAAFAFAA